MLKKIVFFTIFVTISLLLQGCVNKELMKIEHPVRRINSSTFIDDKRFEVSYSSENCPGYVIDEMGEYARSGEWISNIGVGFKFDKHLKLFVNYSLKQYDGNIWMSGIEKSFELNKNIFYAVTAQSQYSTVSETGESGIENDEVKIESEMLSFTIINEFVFNGPGTVLRLGIYFDYVMNNSDITRTDIDNPYLTSTSKVNMEDMNIGIPLKVSLRIRDYELFGVITLVRYLKKDSFNDEGASGALTGMLGVKLVFGDM